MPEEIGLDQAESILKGFKLPPRPEIFTKLKQASPDLDKMSLIVEQDPALAASILKVINSPAIGLSTKVTSISHAMSLLGLRSIMNIINAAFLKKQLSTYLDSELLENYWESTSKVATAMAAIARHLNFKKHGIEVDEAYCLGLFHNASMPMLFDKFPDYFEKIHPTFIKGNIGITEAENHFFKTNHSVLGFYMTKGWGLPARICEVIKLHHNVEILANLDQLEEPVALLLVALKMAEQITGEAEEFSGVDYNKEWVEFSSELTRYIGISAHDFFDLQDLINDTIEKEQSEKQ